MTVDGYRREPCCREALTRLTAEFRGRVPKGVVACTVLEARHDLQGQIRPGALAELLHRLAHHRLDAMVSART
ncbi:hypothetical protein [Saccharothrix yanglingensis]|uniref:Uncharacterized protein n=1 Tax=Saccharothrix yanglingensis TaxID=659496 RepID=A0ABU0X3Y2_9PSEU|nr:hypothetical protein [Saccharothrix yanglingensis]MDQ2586841.1 hypothetical protein [Saccharothrix yanglingensis]